MATRNDVRDRAGELLGLIQPGGTLGAEHSTRILAAYDEEYAALKVDGRATWTSTGAVPAEVVPHFAAIVAFNCADTYAISQLRFQRIAARAAAGRREINALVAPDHESLDDPVDY